MVERAELQIAFAELQHPPVAEPEGDAVSPDYRDLRRVPVDQLEAHVIAGPADAVVGAQFHALHPVDFDRSCSQYRLGMSKAVWAFLPIV